MKLFFIFTFVLMIVNLGLLWYMTKADNANKKIRNIPLKSISTGITCWHVFMGTSELVNLFSYWGVFLFMGIVSLLALLFFSIFQKKHSRCACFALKAVAVASVLELTLFNLPTYRVFFGGYEERILFPSDALIESEGTSLNKQKHAISPDNSEMVLTFENINIPVRTVSATVTFSDPGGVATFVADAKDESYAYMYRYDIGKDKIVAKRGTSNYMTLDLSGNVKDMRIKFKSIAAGTIEIHNMTLNAVIPFEIYYIRFLFLILVSTLIYAVLHSSVLAKSFHDTEPLCRICTAIVAVFCCILTFWVTTHKLPTDTWGEKIEAELGNQVSKELVEAFEHGHVYLDEEPPQELLELDNPYDRYNREHHIEARWDHVFYNGKYYSYYGIAPVILLFLPFHQLTDKYCPNELAVLIFSIIGFTGLAFVIIELIRKWFSRIPAGLYLTAMPMLFLNCGIWFSIARTDFYEVAMASGFAFMTWGIYFLISANILGDGVISLPRTCFCSLFMAIAVLSRPTLVLYCIFAGAVLLFAVKRSSVKSKEETPKLWNKRSIFYLLCAFIPMGTLGAVQMWYNYARFGSPFEFGIQYSLTINNFTKTQFHPSLSWIAIYNYLFNAPVFQTSYPQIHTEYQDMQVNGFFYHDLSTANTSGLFWLMPPLSAYLLSGKALKKLPDWKTKIITSITIGVPCILIPVGIVASVWESGYAARYMSDIAWQMILGAYAVIFFLYLCLKDETKKELVKLFFCGSFVWTFIISGVQIFDAAFRYTDAHYDAPDMAYLIDRLFCFWR